jgi:hypothetical protein
MVSKLGKWWHGTLRTSTGILAFGIHYQHIRARLHMLVSTFLPKLRFEWTRIIPFITHCLDPAAHF